MKKREMHGMRRSPEYAIWGAMKTRCLNPNFQAYDRYGGAGVSICPEWVESFVAFYSHMGPRPTPTHSLDRFPDRHGNYEPGNVRWATLEEQSQNRDYCFLENGDETKLKREWAASAGVSMMTIYRRSKKGMASEDVVLPKQGAPRGTAHARASLTEQQVLEIFASNEPAKVLALRYGTTAKNVSNIRHGWCWSWLTGAKKQVAA